MRTVALPGTELTTSRLALGSSLLMARIGRRQSVRLLEVAHDSGITHFDTARSYGYGEAESALGDFFAHRRDGVTVTTKLGILPPRRSRGLQAAKAVARVAANSAPILRPLLRKGGQSMVRQGRFAPAEARSSLETSLRELRTDTVDILLLHEVRPADLETDGLLDFLEAVVREGKVRSFGLGTDPRSTRTILAERPEFARVVQFAHDPVDATLDPRSLTGTAVFTHSALRTLVGPLSALLGDDRRRRRWSEALGTDCGHPATLGRLLLAHALECNAGGVVLFSSASEDRIRANAALVDSGEFSPQQLRRFGELVRDALTGRDA
jgi:diketogulonate reductase-like aldo/keto reductase